MDVYQVIEHLPVPGEPWVNDVWLLPMRRADAIGLSTLQDISDLLGSSAWMKGYDWFFLSIGTYVLAAHYPDPQVLWRELVEDRRSSGRWLDGPLRILEAVVHPLWMIKDVNEIYEQGLDPSDVPHTYDPNDILDLAGADFQGDHIEADRTTARCQIELRDGQVELEGLGPYVRSLRHGRHVRAYLLRAVIAGSKAPVDKIVAREEWESILQEFPLPRRFKIPRTFNAAVEVPVPYPEAEALLERESMAAGAPLWPDIDPTPPPRPRGRAIPPGVPYPADWAHARADLA